MKILRILPVLTIASTVAVISMSACNVVTVPDVNDTINLVHSPSVVTLSDAPTMDTLKVWLSCGCRFVLHQTGSSGDAAAFATVRMNDDSDQLTPHKFAIFVPPSAVKKHYDGWISFSAVDHYGNTKYDTVHLIADLR
jgi:hypothetical protein